MTRRREHDHADEGPRVRPPAVTDLPLFGGTPAPEPVTPPAPVEDRRQKVRAIHDAGARRWIDAGKPIALLVAAQDGQVTAETFRTAAEKLPHALPPTYGEDRTLSYLSSMFAELVATGHLQKRLRADGSVVKVYSAESRNEHVVYELRARQERAS